MAEGVAIDPEDREANDVSGSWSNAQSASAVATTAQARVLRGRSEVDRSTRPRVDVDQ